MKKVLQPANEDELVALVVAVVELMQKNLLYSEEILLVIIVKLYVE
jgi:hypothetical protein